MSTVRFADTDQVYTINNVNPDAGYEQSQDSKYTTPTISNDITDINFEGNQLVSATTSERIRDGRFTVSPMAKDNIELQVDKNGLLHADKRKSQNEVRPPIDEEDDEEEYQLAEDGPPPYDPIHRPSVFEVVTNYRGGIIQDPTSKANSRRLGTLLGVYFPCIQNILGVIVFIRYPWIIGVSGISGALAVCLLCCSCTLLTAISMSAIATNGRVPAGGSYFMISRSLGSSVGGAVGILFYIANSLSCALYIAGAVEILLKYICPSQCFVFGSSIDHYRLYGFILLVLLTIIVLIGIRFVSMIAPISLFCVLFSILCIYIGLIKAAFSRPDVPICTMNHTHVLKSIVLDNAVSQQCFANSSLLDQQVCGKNSSLCPLLNSTLADVGVPGLRNSQFRANWPMSYMSKGEIAPGVEVKDSNLEVFAIQLTNFLITVGIYFPSVTGIMAGSNRSGDLKDASSSIPKGTIAAILTTSSIYLTYAFLLGSSIDGRLLRDKFGDSIDQSLVVSMIAWPSKWVILIGALLSTLGAGLQTLTGAPRIIQALAKDNVLKFLNVIGYTGSSGEPRRAVLLTALVAMVGVLIGDIDQLTPLLSMFFLLCYGFVNLACALQSLLKTPNWRPTFKYYHWTLSLLGVGVCLAIMFMASWYFALLAVAIAAIIYKYIEYKGAEKEWGDGLTGLQLQAALYALSQLEEDKERHFRNWRPELLVFVQTTNNHTKLVSDRIMSLARQLKTGGGLTIFSTVVVTDNYVDETLRANIAEIKRLLSSEMKRFHLKAFKSVVASKNLDDGIFQLLHNSGLGGMRPNTLVLPWPNNWKSNDVDVDLWNLSYKTFLDTLKLAERNTLAVMVPKNLETFPKKSEKSARPSTTIDIWWILHDAGLMLLTAYLLRKHKVWKNCSLRIFTVAESSNDASLARTYINNVTKSIRIPFQHIQVVVLESSDLSAYAYDRTIELEHGTELLKQLNRQRRALSQQIDCQFTFTPVAGGIMDLERHHQPHTDPSHLLKEANPVDFAAIGSRRTKRVHSALKLNRAVHENSDEASLIIINLPPTPTADEARETYMNFIEVLSDGLKCPILMVRGTGRELITSVE